MKIFKQIIQKIPLLYAVIVRVRLIQRAFSRYGLNFSVLKLFWDIQPYTMVGHARLLNVYELANSVEKKNIEGAFVECGVFKGGCAAIMAEVAKINGTKRNTWLFDSFEGLPHPTVNDGATAAEYAKQKVTGELSSIGENVGPLEDVERILFKILKLSRNSVYTVKGWFQNTLSQNRDKIGPIAILRLDADFYESTKCILDNLYDNVVLDGYIIIDDYGSWEGCKKAVDEFLQKQGVNPQFHLIDASGIYFKKP